MTHWSKALGAEMADDGCLAMVNAGKKQFYFVVTPQAEHDGWKTVRYKSSQHIVKQVLEKNGYEEIGL